MRVPVDTIAAPLFPRKLPWVNVKSPPSSIQRGRPLLVEFWDFCRPNSVRTLPYLKAWHERYAEAGLRIVGVHCPGFEISREEEAVRAAVARLEISYPVLIDSELELWREYENEGWPARYLFDGSGRLFEYHFGEGAYAETERAIQELLGVEGEPVPPLRPEDAPGAALSPPSADREGAYDGPYEAGGVWAVLDGAGTVRVNGGPSAGGAEVTITHPGAYPLLEHARHTVGVLEIEIGPGVECVATCFTPGVS
ncbi:MAG TPA: DipZ protein [Solirubrobacteraceae bacterium]|nr:DipZ protein [Solirubrobacteraceae bacterium]